MKTLIKHEFSVQNKIYNLVKYTLLFFIFCCVSITLINSYENVQIFGVVFALVCIPLVFIGLSTHLIKPDIEDGTLEILITLFSPIKIASAKFTSLTISTGISFFLVSPFIYIIYNLENHLFLLMLGVGSVLILLCSALIILISSIQAYFRSNTNFLSLLIMPLIIPSIILSGILVQNPQDSHLLLIMIGIDLVIIPPALYLSGYLIENIYNI